MVKDTLSADNKQEVVEGKGDTKSELVIQLKLLKT